MSLIFTDILKLGARAWRYEWAATTGPYRVYVNGAEFAIQDETFFIPIETAATTIEPPVVEVLDANDSSTPETLLHPGRAILQWRGQAVAVHYRIEEFVGAAWVAREEVPETGSGYLQFTTTFLDDVTSALWRIIPVDEFLNEGSPAAFDIFIVRRPDAPDLTYTYSGVTGDLTVAAA